MQNCIFCSIAEKKIPATLVYENENVLAFQDLHPVSSLHLLFIHKSHTKNAMDLVEQDPKQIQEIFLGIQEWSKQLKESSFRIITNVGELAGQSVFHTHFHVIGGKKLSWPGI